MEITIKGEPKEIAALVFAVQGQQGKKAYVSHFERVANARKEIQLLDDLIIEQAKSRP